MKVTIAWNVWSNYEDVLLGSEIAKLQNDEQSIFNELKLISQGGFPTPPSNLETTYLDEYFHLNIDENQPLISIHKKYTGLFRVFAGIKNAFLFAQRHGHDFALVTMGDAWCLDLNKLKKLFTQEKVQHSCVSARVGITTGFDLNIGAAAPFFDDHFIILNIKKCSEYGVFDYNTPKSFYPKFYEYGSGHYLLTSLMNEIVPTDMFYAYTYVEDAVNHYGERSGFNLLPLQYQPKYDFLHANCAQDHDLNFLRAKILEKKKLNRYPYTQKYCDRFQLSNSHFTFTEDYVFFRRGLKAKVKAFISLLQLKVFGIIENKYCHHPSLKSHQRFFKIYNSVLSPTLTSRTHKFSRERPNDSGR